MTSPSWMLERRSARSREAGFVLGDAGRYVVRDGYARCCVVRDRGVSARGGLGGSVLGCDRDPRTGSAFARSRDPGTGSAFGHSRDPGTGSALARSRDPGTGSAFLQIL